MGIIIDVVALRVVEAFQQHAGRIVAVVIGMSLMTAAGLEDDTRPYELAQLAVGGALVLAGSLAPYFRRPSAAPPAAPHCDPAELGQLECAIMCRIADLEKMSASAVGEFADELARLRERLDNAA